jgi:hypothetical protein
MGLRSGPASKYRTDDQLGLVQGQGSPCRVLVMFHLDGDVRFDPRQSWQDMIQHLLSMWPGTFGPASLPSTSLPCLGNIARSSYWYRS